MLFQKFHNLAKGPGVGCYVNEKVIFEVNACWRLHDDLKNCLVGVSQGCTFCAPHSLYENLIRRLPHHCLYILQAIIVFSLIIICKQGGISFRCTHSVMSVQAFD
jgi:hypothetical protein